MIVWYLKSRLYLNGDGKLNMEDMKSVLSIVMLSGALLISPSPAFGKGRGRSSGGGGEVAVTQVPGQVVVVDQVPVPVEAVVLVQVPTPVHRCIIEVGVLEEEGIPSGKVMRIILASILAHQAIDLLLIGISIGSTILVVHQVIPVPIQAQRCIILTMMMNTIHLT